ncbi:hypothetical protein N9363_08575 [Paracoccaceae bacterium]|nr:hypothetical protein [Paracoccaceae bacterium]
MDKAMITFKLFVGHHKQAVSLMAIRQWSFGVVEEFELHFQLTNSLSNVGLWMTPLKSQFGNITNDKHPV